MEMLSCTILGHSSASGVLWWVGSPYTKLKNCVVREGAHCNLTALLTNSYSDMKMNGMQPPKLSLTDSAAIRNIHATH